MKHIAAFIKELAQEDLDVYLSVVYDAENRWFAKLVEVEDHSMILDRNGEWYLCAYGNDPESAIKSLDEIVKDSENETGV
jgi:hypothetical protein